MFSLLQIAFIMTLIQYQPPTYEGYEYPVFARALGLMLAVVPLIPLPVLMIIQFLQTPGTFWEVFVLLYILLILSFYPNLFFKWTNC